jgi:hypothetical protein
MSQCNLKTESLSCDRRVSPPLQIFSCRGVGFVGGGAPKRRAVAIVESGGGRGRGGGRPLSDIEEVDEGTNDR